jgi:hypothetical protein
LTSGGNWLPNEVNGFTSDGNQFTKRATGSPRRSTGCQIWELVGLNLPVSLPGGAAAPPCHSLTGSARRGAWSAGSFSCPGL